MRPGPKPGVAATVPDRPPPSKVAGPPLPPTAPDGAPLTIDWLSIDGISDVDCMTFPASAGFRITVRVTPSTHSYSVGPQGSDGTCSGGTPFDSGALRDLSLKLIAPDQATELASSASQPAGQTTTRIVIDAFPDSEVEGPETLVVAIDPASGIASTGSTELTLTARDSPYGTWAAAVLGLTGPVGPSDDFDLDGAVNLEEFAWKTAPDSAMNRPSPTPPPRCRGPAPRRPGPPPSARRPNHRRILHRPAILVAHRSPADGRRIPASRR